MSNTRKAYTLEDKIKMIKACKTKSQAKVSSDFSVAPGTLHGFLKNKDKLMKQYENASTVNVNKKRHREGIYPDMEEALFFWFNEKFLQGALLSGGFIKEKAKKIAAAQGINEFNASNRWLDSFKA